MSFRSSGNFRGTPDRVVVQFGAGGGDVSLRDSYHATFGRAASAAKVERDDARTMVLRWRHAKIRSDNGMIINVDYSLNLTKASGQARISGRPGGVPLTCTGTGRCLSEAAGGQVTIAPQKQLPKVAGVPARS